MDRDRRRGRRDRRGRRADRAAGADQLRPRQGDRHLPRRLHLVRGRARPCCSGSRSSAGGCGKMSSATDVRWYYLIGGLLGAAYVTTVLLTVRTLGAGGVTAATVAGIALLAAGVFLIVRE